MNQLENLNPAQKVAATHREGPLLVVAGAGAGKTKTIVARIINLIHSGINPEAILAITFTNKAAKEMRDRVMAALVASKVEPLEFSRFNPADKTPLVSTFHALGAMIIREQARRLGLTQYFSIVDKEESLSIIKEAMRARGVDPKRVEPRKILGTISRQKGDGKNLQQFSEQQTEPPAGEYFGDIVAQVWRQYEKLLQERRALDFDDLLLKVVELFRRQPEILKHYQTRWQHLHIDEYQDTNTIQYQLAKMLVAAGRNICVVGDVDQSIYSWRGADYKNILRFEEDYPDATVVTLEQNYRSTKTILTAANQVIKKNQNRREKNLFTENKDGAQITLFIGLDEGEEAQLIAGRAGELVKNGVGPSEIAVLYRANFQSRALEEAFLRENIPYRVLGTRFFERKEVKDVLAFIKVALNPPDAESLRRVINIPPRGIGKVTLAKMVQGEEEKLPLATKNKIKEFRALLAEIAKKVLELKPSELIKFVITCTGLEKTLRSGTEEDLERLQNIKELVSLAIKYDNELLGEGIWKLLTEAALVSDQDSLNTPAAEKKAGVNLMTVHAAKGLEFQCVFVSGLEQDLFPSAPRASEKNDRDEEEERRLFYVAITRAKEKLFLSYAQVRTIFGSRQVTLPSEFLGDISEDLMDAGNQVIDW